MGRICKETEDAAVAVCSGISCTFLPDCNSVQCNSFTRCKWWNVPCHVARAACLAAAALARAACWVARTACVTAAELAKGACIAAAAVARAACELVNFVLDTIGLIINLILSIPFIGGIYRTILNWSTELFWRGIGLIDFFGSLAGIRPRKKMYFGVIVPSVAGIATDVDIQRQVTKRSISTIELAT